MSSFLCKSSAASANTTYRGGLELLFSNKHRLSLQLPAADPATGKPATVACLIARLSSTVLDESRKDLFVSDKGVGRRLRPGILVLINDVDWELEGEEAYVLQQGDNILFVSTLHGG